MKNIKYIIFVFITLFFNIFYVEAQCTDDEISKLNKNVNEIKITYKYLGKIEEEDGILNNQYEVVVKNIIDDLYISLYNNSVVLEPSDGKIVSTFNNGTWKFNVYSKKCDKLIDTINVFIPKFNDYSLDPLCEGIDGEDFPLCGKYYEYDVSYNSFKERVEHYRGTHNIDNNINNDNAIKKENVNFKYIIDSIVDFIIKYKLYVFVSLIIIIILIVIVIIIKKKRKRGVLE